MSEPALIEQWPESIWIGGDKDRAWLLWWKEARPGFHCRRYLPAERVFSVEEQLQATEQQLETLKEAVRKHRSATESVRKQHYGGLVLSDAEIALYKTLEELDNGTEPA